MKNIVAIIPARSGSKRIPNKNIAPCAGNPLLGYTCSVALQCHRLSRVVLSTNDPEIAEIGRACGVEVPFLREDALAQDDTLMLPVIQNMLDWLDPDGNTVQAIVLLQPTSPLRSLNDINGAIDLYLNSKPDSVVSVVSVPHIYHPLKITRSTKAGLVPYLDDRPTISGHRDLPPVYARNGPAVLITRVDIIRSGSLYGNRSLPFEMPVERSIDIDDPMDFAFAEFIIKQTRM
jgi:CMP-N,N'-diacetyllegionaminic acid synthase